MESTKTQYSTTVTTEKPTTPPATSKVPTPTQTVEIPKNTTYDGAVFFFFRVVVRQLEILFVLTWLLLELFWDFEPGHLE